MYLKSLYPDIPPNPPLLNAYLAIAGRPDQEEWPDFTAHVEAVTGRTRSFKQVHKRIDDLATALGAPISAGGLGLRADSGEIIGIMSDNSSDYVALVISCMKIAVPFMLISCYSTPFELKHALSIAKVTRIFVAPQYLSRVVPTASEVGLPEEKIYLMNDHVKGRISTESLIRDVNTKKIPDESVCIVPKDTLAYLVFSSGTSGLPKAVMISHSNVVYSIRQGVVLAEERMKVGVPPPPTTPDGIPCTLAVLPMHHSAGLHAYCFRSFLVPSRLVILPRWDTEVALKAIPKYKVTVLSLVPSLVHQMLMHPKVKQINFSSVLSVNVGAAYLPREFLAKLVSYTPKEAQIFEGYGLSECTIAAMFQPFPGTLNGRFKENYAATGVLLPGMEARIVREDGSEADWNEPGELWLRGENVVQGYWNNPKANGELFVNGWLRTGDRFKVDEEQYFYFADRAKDTLKVSGTQVSPMEIEEVLLAHPKKLISDVTVAGVSGGRTEDEKVPRAWVVLSEEGRKAGASTVTRELEAWHQASLSRYKWLRGGIEIVEEIPKSPSGKTLRRALQDKYEKGLSEKRQTKL